MPIVSVNEAGKFGVVTDLPPTEIAPEAWTRAQNMHFIDGVARKVPGEVAAYGAATVAPLWLLQCFTLAGTPIWLYAGAAHVYATDGVSTAQITRGAGTPTYTAGLDTRWTGSNFNGLGVLSNPGDVPQMWGPVSLATDLQALTAWDANWKCGSLRAFKNFLIAVNITKSGVAYPQMVKWSSSADPGFAPASWDATDLTNDAGEQSLADTSGVCIDSLPLGDMHIVYKDDSLWRMAYIGGGFIFRFEPIVRSLGILGVNCAYEFTPGQHAAFCRGDLIVHNGSTSQSIVRGRVRSAIFNELSSAYAARSFVSMDYENNEVWFCYPAGSATIPNKAAIWNIKTNQVGFRDLDDVTTIGIGNVAAGVSEPVSWASDTAPWSSDSTPWSYVAGGAALSQQLIGHYTDSNFGVPTGTMADRGVSMPSVLERTGIGVVMRANTPPDFTAGKLVTEVWPRISGTAGGVVNIYVGGQASIDVEPTYQGPFPYIIGTTKKINCRVYGRTLALKFETTTDIDWRLHGYEMQVQPAGIY